MRSQIETMKAEANRWNSLTEEEQEVEEEAEFQGISKEEARRYLEEWYRRSSERQELYRRLKEQDANPEP